MVIDGICVILHAVARYLAKQTQRELAVQTAASRIASGLVGIMALAGLAIGPAAGVSMAATHSAATPSVTINPPAPPTPQPDPWDV
jgi:hypothetical protein